MDNKQIRKRYLSLFLALVMLIGTLPVNIFAETFTTNVNGNAVVGTTDWSIDEKKEAEMSYWKLANINDLVIVANGEGIKTPSVNYIGTYINAEGRTVIRASFRMFQNLSSGVWHKALFKFDKDLYELIDFNNTRTGMYKGAIDGGFHDNAVYNQIVAFADCVSSYSGAVHVKEQSLTNNGNKVGGSSRLEIPIDLVLKEGKTVKDIKGQPHIQMRITNKDYTKVFCVAGTEKSDTQKNLIAPYNSYTFMTYIPSDNNNADVGTVSDYNVDKQFYSANSYAKYNEAGGYLDVFHKQSKLASGDKIGGESFAFRQVFNEKFAEVLKPQDGSGTVAEVFTANQQGEMWKTSKPIKITMNDLNTSANSDLKSGFYGIQVASSFKNGTITNTGKFAGLKTVITTENPTESFLNSSTTEFNSGLPTITRYYIDKDKVAAKGLTTDDLAAFDFYSTFILDSQKKFIEYTATNNTGADIVLPANSKIGLTYANNPTSTPNTELNKYSLTFGEGPYKIEMRSNFTHTGKLLNGNVGRQYEYNLIPGMTIKAGEKITFRTMKYNTPPSKVTLTLPSTNGAKTIDLLPGTNGAEVTTPRRLNYITTYAGGSASQTNLPPDVDEIFTDSKNITGRTKYKLAKMRLYYPDNTEFEFTIDDNPLKDVVVNGQTFKGYTFTTDGKSGIYTNNGAAEKIARAFAMPTLKKDMPIDLTNRDELKASVASDKVTEQVQAKVHFDLNGQKSKIDGRGVIDKIAPLNKEYLYKMVEQQDPSDATKKIKKFVKNDDYKASGFAKLDKDGTVTGTDHLKVDSTNGTVTVKQKLTDSQQQTTTIDRKVINYIDHDGRLYDITAKDQKIKDDQINKLLMRQFPVNEEVNLPNAKRIIGWTTVKLEDQKDNNGKVTKTAEEQYYDLLNSKDAASGKNNKIVRKLEDWAKAGNEAYVYDEASPLEDERTVYAVYGGLSIVLHSGNYDANGNEITLRLPVTQDDLDYTDQTLDATTSATLQKLSGKIVMKKMPKAPYTSDEKDIAAADEQLKEFKRDNNSFVGWTILSDQSNFRAGNNNPRISALLKGEITLEDGSKTTIPKESESLKNLIMDKLSAANKKATLPNGFTFAFSPDNFDKDANFTVKKADGLDTRQKLLDTVSEIHLYAVYRPYFDVTVKPQYKKVDKTKGTYGEYVEDVASEKQKPLLIGLLTRTAVTGYGKPTVDAAANYNPIGDASKVLKTWNPTSSTPLTWKVPGFDTLGRRKSYVSVVVPQGKEGEYTNFANPFSDQSWSKLGISTYTKAAGASLDPNAPKNLYKDSDTNSKRDPYGVALAKTQAFTTGTNTDLDAFTSATARKPLLSDDEEEVKGYDIVMTNALESLPTPKFDKVKDTDTKVTLEWKKGTAEAPTDYDKIDKIEFYLNGNTYTFTKGQDGKFTSGTKTATINTKGDKIEVTGITLEGMGGKDLQAKYFATVAGNETSGEIGSTRIISDKTSAPVTKMEQGVKNNPTDKPTIKFTVPEKTLDQVGTGSKYIAEKWVPNSTDPSKGTWVKVGERTLTDADKENEKFQGNEYEMELTGPVADSEKVRIVSYEKNPDATYTEDEKQADPALEDGFSKPAYSTRKTITVQDPKDANKTITKEVSAVTEAPVAGKDNTEYVTLDLKAPTPKATATEDEAFRRFIDIKGQLDEIPAGQKVTIEFGDTQGATGNKTITFDTKEKAISYINQIPRDENMPKMWIIAKDSKGNQSATKVDYNRTYQCKVEVVRPRAGRPFIAVKSDKPGVEIVVEVTNNGVKVAEGKVTTDASTANKIARLDFKKFENNALTAEVYRLQVGDVLEVKGSVTIDEKLYTTNPYSREVED